MEEVDPRRSLVNALITLGVVAVLAFVGFIIRMSKGETVRMPISDERHAVVFDEHDDTGADRILSGLEERRGQGLDGTTRIVNRELVYTTARNPLMLREELDRFEVLVGCELLERRDSTASALWLANHGREFVGHLYFSMAPEPGSGFGKDVDIGAEAMQMARGLLGTRTTRLFTRWEPVEGAGEGHYYVMIYVEGEGGSDRRFLSEILVANGLADFREREMLLPDGRTQARDFVRRLSALEQMARAGKRGAWRLQTAAR